MSKVQIQTNICGSEVTIQADGVIGELLKQCTDVLDVFSVFGDLLLAVNMQRLYGIRDQASRLGHSHFSDALHLANRLDVTNADINRLNEAPIKKTEVEN